MALMMYEETRVGCDVAGGSSATRDGEPSDTGLEIGKTDPASPKGHTQNHSLASIETDISPLVTTPILSSQQDFHFFASSHPSDSIFELRLYHKLNDLLPVRSATLPAPRSSTSGTTDPYTLSTDVLSATRYSSIASEIRRIDLCQPTHSTTSCCETYSIRIPTAQLDSRDLPRPQQGLVNHNLQERRELASLPALVRKRRKGHI